MYRFISVVSGFSAALGLLVVGQAAAKVTITSVTISGPSSISCGGSEKYEIVIEGDWDEDSDKNSYFWCVWDEDPGPDDQLTLEEWKKVDTTHFVHHWTFELNCVDQEVQGNAGSSHESCAEVYGYAAGDWPPGGVWSAPPLTVCCSDVEISSVTISGPGQIACGEWEEYQVTITGYCHSEAGRYEWCALDDDDDPDPDDQLTATVDETVSGVGPFVHNRTFKLQCHCDGGHEIRGDYGGSGERCAQVYVHAVGDRNEVDSEILEVCCPCVSISSVAISGPTRMDCGEWREYHITIKGTCDCDACYYEWSVWDDDNPDPDDQLTQTTRVDLTAPGPFEHDWVFRLQCACDGANEVRGEYGGSGEDLAEVYGCAAADGAEVRSSVLSVQCGPACVLYGNVRAKADCSVPEYDCIYTQSGWHKGYYSQDPKWWYHGCWSDGSFSEMIAQAFAVPCDSLVRDVYVGGGFRYEPGDQMPESITLDIYRAQEFPECEREATGSTRPGWIVERYVFETSDIYPTLWSDVWGCIYTKCGGDEFDFEKVRLTLDPPLSLDADYNYLISCYANGSSVEPFYWTMDMLSGPDRYALSEDAGQSWSDWYEGGEVSVNLDFELRGELLDCYCLCDVCDYMGFQPLYDQASKHSHTQGQLWASMSYGGDPDDTRILGQAFHCQRDGYVECVGVGGSFGQMDQHAVPEHLIVEVWCLDEQVGQAQDTDGLCLLRRWMVPVDELYESEDPEGYPLLNFFTQDYPGPYTWCDSTAPGGGFWVTDDRPFMFVAYSDGDYYSPLEWYTDMCKGYCTVSKSTDCENTWRHCPPFLVPPWGWDPWEPPEPPHCGPEANLEFILCGGCGETHAPTTGDEPVESGYIKGPLFGQPQGGYPGWVWFSIPLDPVNCCSSSPRNCYDPPTLLGFACKGVLWKWDKYGKYVEVYQPPFVKWDLNVGDSYIFRMTSAVSNPTYSGVSPHIGAPSCVDRDGQAEGEPGRYGYAYAFQLGRMGWTWVGLPGDRPIYGGDLNYSDFATKVKLEYPAGSGTVRTASEDVMSNSPWANWGWAYWDTYLQAPKTFKYYVPFGNKHCFPWIGYRVWVNVGTATGPYCPGASGNEDQVVLIWPAPECFYPDFSGPVR